MGPREYQVGGIIPLCTYVYLVRQLCRCMALKMPFNSIVTEHIYSLKYILLGVLYHRCRILLKMQFQFGSHNFVSQFRSTVSMAKG